VGLMEMLALAYPICRRLLGEEFFEALAREYVRATPSCSGNLHHYGAALADFIAGFAPCAELPYLPDVARLEWALHHGYYAPDAPCFELAALAAMPQPQWGALRFAPHPACRVLDTRWPLAAIHRWHQPGGEHTVVDMQQPQPLLLYRDQIGRMQLLVLDAAGCRFAGLLLAGETLAAATDAALTLDAGFDLQAALLRLLQHGCLSALKE
ncbi:putative DNA-binding domain-containing protein, partial [Vogesella facilis]